MFGYQAVYDPDFYDALGFAADNGFDYVSFDLNVPRFYLDELTSDNLDQIRKMAARLGVGVAFHAPGDNISLFTDYPAARSGIIEHFSLILNQAARLNARHVVVHPGLHPVFKKSGMTDDDFTVEYADYFVSVLCGNLEKLASVQSQTMLCVENFGFNPLVARALEQLWAADAPVFLTWDIAKGYNRELERDEAVETFMRSHLSYIREVHVHDIKRGFRSHQTLGSGDLDFGPYLDLMRQPGLAVTIEVRPREEALESLHRLRELLR